MATTDFARDYRAITEGYVSQGAADYCTTHGHAVHTVDGVAQGVCPRCLADTVEYERAKATHMGHALTVDTPMFGTEDAEAILWCDTCDITVWYLESDCAAE